MHNMRIPTRRAPTVEDARRAQLSNNTNEKKKPPPRPPPPNFAKAKSKSAWNLSQGDNLISLIDWSPPSSPITPQTSHTYNGSISSSFSSSTSSLASSKKSYEYESVQSNNDWMQVASSTFYQNNGNKLAPPPTIIRAAPPKKPSKTVKTYSSSASTSREVSPLPPYLLNIPNIPHAHLNHKVVTHSLPMPNIPPPSPPKLVTDDNEVAPFGIALYDYASTQQGDLHFQVNDIVYLIRTINEDWYYGRVDEREGMFPKNFVDVQIPMNENGNNLVTARYDFVPQLQGDLCFKSGDSIRILRIIDNNWLEGECNGRRGQFPSSYVDRIPTHL